MRPPLAAGRVAEIARAEPAHIYIRCQKCAVWLCLVDFQDACCPQCKRFNDEACAILRALEHDDKQNGQ
jgi:phage FluMu protein Com